jgi:hypothetical protein
MVPQEAVQTRKTLVQGIKSKVQAKTEEKGTIESFMKMDGPILPSDKESNMLWTLVVILLILWLLGLIGGYTLGGVIHVLLVIAVIVIVVQLIQGRRRL